MRRSSVVVALFGVLAVHAILLWIYHVPAPKALWGDEQMYWDVAVARAAGDAATVEMLWPPLYPRLLSWLVTPGGGGLLWVQLVQTAMLVAGAGLLRDVWRRLIAPGPAADAFALALLAWPPFVAYAHYIWPEVLHFLLFSAALWILAARRDRPVWLAGLGVVLGLALLTKSVLLPFLPVLLVPIAWGVSLRDGALRGGLVLVTLALTVAPTVVSNHGREGVWGIAASGRFNLWVGLNDDSRRPFVDEVVGREYQTWKTSAPTIAERNAILDEKILARVTALGVPALVVRQSGVQYFRLFDKDSFLTLQLPGGTIHERGKGYRDPPRGVTAVLQAVSVVGWAVLLVLAALGVALCPPRGRGFVWLVLAFIVYNLVLFLAVHVKARYRFPLIPFLIAYAVVAVAGWRAWRRGLAGPLPFEPTPARLAGGAMGALLALFFAFGGAWLDG